MSEIVTPPPSPEAALENEIGALRREADDIARHMMTARPHDVEALSVRRNDLFARISTLQQGPSREVPGTPWLMPRADDDTRLVDTATATQEAARELPALTAGKAWPAAMLAEVHTAASTLGMPMLGVFHVVAQRHFVGASGTDEACRAQLRQRFGEAEGERQVALARQAMEHLPRSWRTFLINDLRVGNDPEVVSAIASAWSARKVSGTAA